MIPQQPKNFLLFAGLALLLSACGGGGGGANTTQDVGTPEVVSTLAIKPSLGCFRNVNVTVFDVTSGSNIGSGKVGSSNCQASVSLTNYSGGPVILKAALLPQPDGYNAATYCSDTANAACFFNEGTSAWEPYVYSGGLEAMLAPIPSLEPSKVYGINKVTNALAASLSIPTNFDTDTNQLATLKANLTSEAVKAKAADLLQVLSAAGITDIYASPKIVAASAQDVVNMQNSAELDGFSALFLTDALESNPLTSALTFQKNVAKGDGFSAVFLSAVTNAKSFVNSDVTTRKNLVTAKQSVLQQTTSQQTTNPPTTNQPTTNQQTNSSTSVTVSRTSATFSQADMDVVASTVPATLRVVPMLGQIAQGATVELINPLDGATTKIIATATVNSDGYADVKLPDGFQSSMVVKVYDPGKSLTYYDVGRSKLQSLGVKPIYALVPATKRVGDGAVIGVTAVTDMAAALAGIGQGAEVLTAQGANETERLESIYQKMLTAYAQSIYLIGWTGTKSLSAAYQLNPLLPPTRITAAKLDQGGIDIGQAGGVWAVFFAEMSKQAVQNGFLDMMSFIHATSSNGDVGLRAIAEGIRADLSGGTDKIKYSSELVATVFRSVNRATYDGSAYANPCIVVPVSVYRPISTVFQSATNANPSDDFKSSAIAGLVLELKESMATLLNGNPKRINLDRSLKTGCSNN